jgi:hypothetical protein
MPAIKHVSLRVSCEFTACNRVQVAGCHALHAICSGNSDNIDVLARQGGSEYMQQAAVTENKPLP